MSRKQDPLEKNAEVTSKGVKPRSSRSKASSDRVVKSRTPTGKQKKTILYSVIAIQTFINLSGVFLNWEPWMWHLFYLIIGITSVGVLTVLFSNVE